MYEWFSDPAVMKVLGFYGGGAASVIGGLWVAFDRLYLNTRLAKSPVASTAQQREVSGGHTHHVSSGSILRTSRAAWVTLGVGVLGITAAAMVGHGSTNIDHAVSVEGVMTNSTIHIGQ
ncbi:hypothetical protein [Rhodobacter sp. NSM]|uniref:hypothetical protein n=1 Tax=Rhodobacter sp. NSM TaxID=3457501 RepID=UPI003FCF3D46